jgi:hypothetical protein
MSIVNGSEGISGDVNNGSEESQYICPDNRRVRCLVVSTRFIVDHVDCGGLCGVSVLISMLCSPVLTRSSNQTVKQLRILCREQGLSTQERKAELIMRLAAAAPPGCV